MESARSKRDYQLTWDDPTWQIILIHWPQLSDPDKLAWGWLWHASRGGREELSVTNTIVGAACGRSDDAGAARLRNLKRAGLIRVVDRDKRTGRLLIRLDEPIVVARARRAAGDPQGLFAFMDEYEDVQPSEPDNCATVRFNRASSDSVVSVAPEPSSHGSGASGARGDPTEVSPEEPRSRTEEPPEEPRGKPRCQPSAVAAAPSVTSETSVSDSASSPLPIRKLSEDSTTTPSAALSDGARELLRGTSGGTSEQVWAAQVAARQAEAQRGEAPPPEVAVKIVAALERRDERTEGQKRLAAEELIARMRYVVNDPQLAITPCLDFAWHIVEERIPRKELEEILHDVVESDRQGKIKTSRGRYFVGCRNRCYQRHSIPTPLERSRKRS